MKSRFQNYIESRFPSLQTKRLLIAVSGGVDSMVLVDLLRELSFHIVVAHCNFQLRGEDSDRDEMFVKSYCEKHNICFHAKPFETKLPKHSTQMAARTLRYEWFNQLCSDNDYDYILTAHHADDAIETLLINMSRGSGIDGLTGIAEQNGKIIRPFLTFFKSELIDWATQNNIPWREDKSNQSTDYLRNAIRHNVINQIAEVHPKALENILKSMQFTRDAAAALAVREDEMRKELFVMQDDNSFRIDLKKLLKIKPLSFWTHRFFSSFGFDHLEVEKLMNAQKGKLIQSTTHTLEMGRGFFLLYQILNQGKEETISVPKEGLSWPILLSISENAQAGSENELVVDAQKISFPLTLRKWKNGDHFYPTGMNGSKKVAKFFKDEHYSANMKAAQWLLCSENDIIWIVGKRADRRFATSGKTKKTIKINLQ
jgi:tRNA(Ile)-lysidine synthase